MNALGTMAVVAITAGVALDLPQTPAQRVFRSQADAVMVDVAVRSGRALVNDLTDRDFDVFDNGVKQHIETLSVENRPVDVTLVLDANRDARSFTDRARAIAADVARNLHADDRLRIIAFGLTVTASAPVAAGAATRSLDTVPLAWGRSLNDALLRAMAQPAEPGRRRLIVVFTNGRKDLGSVLGSAGLKDVAARADVVTDVVLADPDWLNPTETAMAEAIDRFEGSTRVVDGLRWQSEHPAPELKSLADVCAVTGGEMYQPSASRADIVQAMAAVMGDFFQRYLVYYVPTSVKRPGWHDVVVKLRSGRSGTVIARKGYFGG